jgi:hypothetical protein
VWPSQIVFPSRCGYQMKFSGPKTLHQGELCPEVTIVLRRRLVRRQQRGSRHELLHQHQHLEPIPSALGAIPQLAQSHSGDKKPHESAWYDFAPGTQVVDDVRVQ